MSMSDVPQLWKRCVACRVVAFNDHDGPQLWKRCVGFDVCRRKYFSAACAVVPVRISCVERLSGIVLHVILARGRQPAHY